MHKVVVGGADVIKYYILNITVKFQPHVHIWKIFQKVPESTLRLNIIVFSTVFITILFKPNHKGPEM